MEGDEVEMTEKELRRWIRRKVWKNQLIVAVVEKCHLLRSLLKRRQHQAILLQQLYRSVAACEGLVKRHYSLLGWEYQDTCSDDKISTAESESPSANETSDHGFSSTHRLTSSSGKPEDSPNLCMLLGKTFHINPNRHPVVVLTPLSPRLISSSCSPAPKSSNNENEHCHNFNSDPPREPDSDEESNSDFSITNDDTPSKKSQRIDEIIKFKNFLIHRASQKRKTSSTKTFTYFDEAITNRLAESKTPANKDALEPPSIPDVEVCTNMTVLARNRINGWQKGKVIKIVRNEQSIQMYKVRFEDEKKHLVPGHHIAFGNSAQLDQLRVGSCVVVECADRVPLFHSGILAELPTFKNKQRFLVFLNDHTPVYVTLSSIHSVCKPLKNPLDDIADEMHKNFMQKYLDAWPYPPRVQYCVGQKISATLNGILQTCEVVVTDSSLIQVVFEVNRHKDWIYRGSPRLEHIMKNNLFSKLRSQN